MNNHLLQCSRHARIKRQSGLMVTHFQVEVQVCRWNDCGYRFRSRSAGTYSAHVTEHLRKNVLHQCLWEACGHNASTHQSLSHHVSTAHGVPNDWTMPTKSHYCYEHGYWYMSDMMWSQHLQRDHLERMNGYCGIVRRHGLVIVAAHCLFCLGDNKADLQTRFHQFHDVYVLHKHMKQHLESDGPPAGCPHPQCHDKLGSNEAFWRHANEVHGTPPYDLVKVNRKRSLEEDPIDDTSVTRTYVDC